ncbi:hypothetical protein FHS95_002380 [Sphingomonas naasensis]|uniref:Uncharacterized protein n=1 Tax=Sphingomonas naasensis TaxID=1344951 RepID=A0A4S1W4P4_9SPHN|nr:hypothetical protein [Sphingomonas naasensis]NIJ20688.1 hypothetical protein [Sphingomonas naasensis]TGX37589.1 hypothetical protein E5A74_19780 [Sphingomonas naasensis]
MFKKLAVITAASAMVFASTAAQAGSASALSLRNAPAVETHALGARASTPTTKQSNVLGGTALYAVIGIIGVFVLLEATEVINVFGGGDDSPDSP